MFGNHTHFSRLTLLAGAAYFALAFGPGLVGAITGHQGTGFGTAYAEDSGGQHKGGQQKGKGGQGGRGSSASDHGQGQGGKIEDKVFHGGTVTGGEEGEVSTDKRGPRYGGGKVTGKPTNAGTKKGDLFGDMYIILRNENGVPILKDGKYVQPIAFDANGNMITNPDGTPVLLTLTDDGEIDTSNVYVAKEVDLGRLSVARAPEKVLSHAYDEAVTTLTNAVPGSITLDASGRISYQVLNDDGTKTTSVIDSPLENLALYEMLVKNGYLPTSFTNPTPLSVNLGNISFLTDGDKRASNDMTVAASLLAAASDKTGNLDQDEVYYMNSILGINSKDNTTYVNFSTYTYDREATWDQSVRVLELTINPDGTYTSTVKSGTLYDLVFGSEAYKSTSGISGFAQAADDAVQVIEFLHDNKLLPPDTSESAGTATE